MINALIKGIPLELASSLCFWFRCTSGIFRTHTRYDANFSEKKFPHRFLSGSQIRLNTLNNRTTLVTANLFLLFRTEVFLWKFTKQIYEEKLLQYFVIFADRIFPIRSEVILQFDTFFRSFELFKCFFVVFS